MVNAMMGILCTLLWAMFFSGAEIFATEIYINIWAVKIRGSPQEAKQLALKHGFSYDKHVSSSFLCAFVRL